MQSRFSHFLLTLCVIGVCTLVSQGQSGRKNTQQPAPLPVAIPPTTVVVEEQPVKITSLVIGGEVTTDSLYYHSSDLDLVTKEFIFWMKYEPRPFLVATKGGKMKYDAAKEAAKKETGRHLLWLGIKLKNDAYGGLYVAYVDYAILMPNTGRPLLNGQLVPGDQKILAQGGVMKIPTVQKQTSSHAQLKQAARELALRLKSTSWF